MQSIRKEVPIMNGEDIFKSIVSGEDQSILGDVARAGLSLLSKGYKKAVTMRNSKFDANKGVVKVSVPVISVGNITAGGTGKTPMVRLICDILGQKGFHPTVLSRGYRAKDNSQNTIISKHGSILVEPEESGDEAWLLAKVLPKSSVIIGRNRIESARIAIDELGADYLVMDDGFQHRALYRDKDIVLIDASNPFGYEHVLPRGLLREPMEGLARADIIVLTKVDQVDPGLVAALRKRLARMVPQKPVYETIHKPRAVYTLEAWANGDEGNPIGTDNDLPIMAVSGIGNPQSFTKTLEDCGYDVVHTMGFGDHHDFSDDDVVEIWKQAFAHQAKAIMITEKDAVKLSQLHTIEDLKIPILVLSIGIEFLSGKQEFIENLEI